jgi:protein required for attachment to host cells
MPSTWILVANSSHARIFSSENGAASNDWKLVHELEHPESRLHSRELRQRLDLANAGTSYRPSQEVQPDGRQEHEAKKFAAEVAQTLERGLYENQCEELVLVSPPEFLGMVREKLGKRALTKVSATLDVDYSKLPERDLVGRIGG